MKRPKLKQCSKLWAWVDEEGYIVTQSISGTKGAAAVSMPEAKGKMLAWGWTLRKIKIQEIP